jgi:hypothetical protein
MQYSVEYNTGGAAMERQHARCELIQDNAEGENVRSGVDVAGHTLFWRHIPDRPEYYAASRTLIARDGFSRNVDAGQRRAGPGDSSKPEVENFDVVVLQDENIRWLEIPMNTPCMDCYQGTGNLQADMEVLRWRRGRGSVVVMLCL